MRRLPWVSVLPSSTALLAAGLLTGCGGDGAEAGTGNDEKYVAALCKASLAFNKSYMDILEDPDNASKSPSEALKLFAKPYEAFVQNLDKASPPADARDYHDDMVEALEKNLRFFKEGDTDAIDSLLDNEFPTPPDDVNERFQQLAAKNRDCKSAGVMFDG